MATIGEISAAINLIDVKKDDLHKSFLQLQSQSPSSLNSNLKWADFDSYFTTLQTSLQHKFNRLQTLYPPSDTPTVLARPELKSFCENSDGLGLMRFIARPGNQLSVLAELPDAYRCAPDAAAMVLDAISEFYSHNAGDLSPREYRLCKRSCVIMLQGLLRVKPDVTIELKNKAMEMAMQCYQKRVTVNGEEILHDAVKFLLLVGVYGLMDSFSMDQLIDCFAMAPKGRHILGISRLMIPANYINDLIQKLISKSMHVAAVYYSIEFQKTDEFPPLRLLEERKLMSMKTFEEMRKKEKHLQQIEAIMKEIITLKSLIKCVNEYKLEYPKDSIVDLVKELKNHIGQIRQAANKHKNDKRSRKQPATPTVSKKPKINNVSKKPKETKFSKKLQVDKSHQAAVPTSEQNVMPHHQSNPKINSVSKKPKVTKFSKKLKVEKSHQAAVPTSEQNVMPHHQFNPQRSDLLPDNLGPYAGLIAGLFGLRGANIGYSGNPTPAGVGPSFYPTQSQRPSVYNSNGGFGYQPSYYPK